LYRVGSSRSYNRFALPKPFPQILRTLTSLARLTLLSAALAAAQAASGITAVMVMPFDNHSKATGLDWITEACPEVLAQRMSSAKLNLVTRDDRIFVFDRAGVPAAVHPSRATVFNVAEQVGADYVVLGNYAVEGTSLQVSAQLLDVKMLKLYAPVQISGPLADFVDVQTSLAWDLLRQMPNPPQVTRQQFVKSATPIPLNSFENYVRGIMSTSRQLKIRYFKEAIRLNPSYALAELQLGKVYYNNHEYEQAALWLSKIPKDDRSSGQATFLLGMSEYYRGNLDRAYVAFGYLATRLPLTEVYNNLGVVDARRGRRAAAAEYFSKAVAADPKDPDYRFNMALALFKNNDNAGAARQLREELLLRPTDVEAKSLLEMINRGVIALPSVSASTSSVLQPPIGQPRIPIERIKREYDEALYRQLEMEIEKLNQQHMTKVEGGGGPH
jgi:tetratricopeptide (TPR) repeat protein